MKVLARPGPQWDRAADYLADLCTAGHTAALRIAASCPASAEIACRYHDGESTPEGRLVERIKALVYWDDTEIDDGRPEPGPYHAPSSTCVDRSDIGGGGYSKVE